MQCDKGFLFIFYFLMCNAGLCVLNYSNREIFGGDSEIWGSYSILKCSGNLLRKGRFDWSGFMVLSCFDLLVKC